MPPGPTRRVLVVDDEADIRLALKDLLESGLPDVDVTVAPDAAAALTAFEEVRPQLVVTDFKMPGMNGIELLQILRDTAPGTPGILITAFPDLELALRAINEGRVEAFLQKPVDPQALLDVVEATLQRLAQKHEQERALARTLNARRLPPSDAADAAP